MATPILSKQFFSKHAPHAGFFSKWRDLAPWADNCLPIYEWEGLLFVGCLFVPENFPPLNQKVIFVLCDPESLKQVWYEFQGTVVAKPRVQLKPAPLDAPEGLLSDYMTSKTDESSAEHILADEFSVKAEDPSEDAEKSESSLDQETDFLNLSFDQEATVVPKQNVLRTQNPVSLEIENKTDLAVETEKSRVDSSLSSFDPNSPSLELKSFLDTFYSEMKTRFQKSMIFLKEEDSMKPWNWDPELQASCDPIPNVSLATPSPWRIVMKTHMPYHGYLVPNELNNQFFATWNHSQIPEHLTLTPILVEDQVIGMVLGIGDKSANNKLSLQLGEHWAQKIATKIKSQPNFYKAS